VAYLISVLAAAAGIVVLLTLMLRLAAPVHRLAVTLRVSRAVVADRTDRLAARIAALRGELDRRRRRRSGKGSTPASAA